MLNFSFFFFEYTELRPSKNTAIQGNELKFSLKEMKINRKKYTVDMIENEWHGFRIARWLFMISMHNSQFLLTFTTLKYVTFDCDTLINQKPVFLFTHLFRSFVFQASEMDIRSGALVDWLHRRQKEDKRYHHTTSVDNKLGELT